MTIPIIKAIAALIATATLGTGATGTATAAGLPDTRTDAAATTVTATADTSSLPDHLINGTFDYPTCPGGKAACDVDPTTGWGGFYKDFGGDNKFAPIDNWDRSKFGWDSDQEGMRPDQQPTSHQKLQHCVQLGHANNNNGQKVNRYAEIIAETPTGAIYQDIATVPGVMYRWTLKHASASTSHADSMAVMIGDPGKETAQEATRTTVNGYGDKLGKVGTTITTKGPGVAWETYTGTYIATSTVTRFTYRSLQGDTKLLHTGNWIDDVSFDKAYKLTYDKNASDATGQVPSDQYGKENTTQPAKTNGNGKVRLASDTTALPDHLVNGDFSVNYHDQWKNTDWTSIDPNNGRTLVQSTNWKWYAINGWDKAKFAWSSTQKAGSNIEQKANAVELQYDAHADNMYAELCAHEAGTAIYQDIATMPGTLYRIELDHTSRYSIHLDQMQVMVGAPGHEQPVEMTRTSSNKYGDKIGEKSTTIATHSTNPFGNQSSKDDFSHYVGYYTIPAGQSVTRFTFRQVSGVNTTSGNLLDNIVFTQAYKLDYDRNSDEATGQTPNDTATVQPAEARGTGTVKTVADDDSSKSLTVNPGFDVPDYSKLDDGGLHWMYVSPAEGKAWSYYDYINPAQPKHQVAGLSQATFGWQELTGGDHETTAFELHREKDGNVCADVHGSRTIGQTIDTQAGVAYTVSIRHSGRSKGNAGSVQVLVGPDKDHLRPLEMSRMNVSRTGAKYGDGIGKVGTVITTHSDSVDSTEGDHPAWDHADDWETYSGTYVATGGKTVFAYRGVDKNGNAVSGNDSVVDSVIDDLSFKLAYRLSYDKNAQDAAGQVPSNERGKENTVQPAKAKTTGTVSMVTDKTSDGLTVHDLKNGEITPVQYGDFKFSTTDGFTADQVTDVNGFTVKTNWDPTEENQAYAGILATMYQPNGKGASLILHHVGQWRDSSGTQRWLNAKITVNDQNLGTLVYIPSTRKFVASYGKWDKHPSSRPYMDVTVDFLLDDGSTPHGLRGATGFTDIDGGTSGYNEGVELVSGFDGAYVRSDAHLTRFSTNGWAGITDENKNDADAHGMKHYVGATFTGSSFRVRWSVASGQARQSGFQPVDSTIAYRLTYDKNAADASGQVPSNTTPDTTQTASSKSTGKVSDLVQRTTTHADGSVTVKTIDTSTDVVSGCQVYYPVGAKIRLATLAKDDDCWDSTMLTRPDVDGRKMKMLGWSEFRYQDDNAGALSTITPTVTMPVGGKTVYAVWVSSGVTLTYNVNTPEGVTPPVTPNGITVPYNTVINDTSGWKIGSTTVLPGYRFRGWYTDPRDVIEPTDPRCEIYPNMTMCQPQTVPLYPFWGRALTADITVYAHWERADTQVVYDANGGKGAHAPTDGRQHSTITTPSDVSQSFSRDGYSFAGWNTKPDGSGVSYKDGDGVPVEDKAVTLYAQWRAKIFVMPAAGGDGGPSPLTVIPAVIAGLALMVGLAGTRRRFKASRQTGRHGR